MRPKNIHCYYTLLLLFLSSQAFAQITDPKATEVWEPEPRAVKSPSDGTAPSDAIVLFDGSNLDEWVALDGESAGWKINEDGSMTVVGGAGNIVTKRKFGDIQLHLEFSAPAKVEGEGQGRGNSGMFMQKRYEVQVHKHQEIKGITENIGLPKNIAHGEDAIMLQDHSNPVSYRNIWVREL